MNKIWRKEWRKKDSAQRTWTKGFSRREMRCRVKWERQKWEATKIFSKWKKCWQKKCLSGIKAEIFVKPWQIDWYFPHLEFIDTKQSILPVLYGWLGHRRIPPLRQATLVWWWWCWNGFGLYVPVRNCDRMSWGGGCGGCGCGGWGGCGWGGFGETVEELWFGGSLLLLLST